MEEQFDRWNEHKKRLSQSATPPPTFPKQGEVWICSLGWNLGREQNGGPHDFSRPVLVVKKFNNEMFWIVPLSSKQKELDYLTTEIRTGNVSLPLSGSCVFISITRFQRNMYQLSSL